MLPCGTAYFIGVVLITMMTGRLAQGKGSLARAVLPKVVLFSPDLDFGGSLKEKRLRYLSLASEGRLLSQEEDYGVGHAPL